MSAAVLGALVILWAIVLVPMWLRRHDRSNEVASADRFAGAMRVLSRRPGARPRYADSAGGRYVMAPRRSAEDHVPHVTVSATDDFEISGPSRYAALAAEGRRRVANTKALTARFTGKSPASDETMDQEAVTASRAGSAGSRSPGGRPSRNDIAVERARKVAQRRRLVVAMAVSLVLSLVFAVLAGGIFVGLQVFVDVLVLAGLAHLRAEVVIERARSRRLSGPRAVARPAMRPATRTAPRQTRVAESRPAESTPRQDRTTPDVAPAAPAAVSSQQAPPVRRSREVPQPVTASQREAIAVFASPDVSRVDSSIIVEPAVAVPAGPVVAAERSTKKTAPAVRPPRSTRTVDLTQPGKWSERQAVGAAEGTMPAYVTGELVADQRAERDEIERTSEFELDLILGRAVGE